MTLPKITKTHRWDRKLIARVEDLARRTGRPVQHVLDDAVAIGLEQIEDTIDERMRSLTPAEAWGAFVGSQTPQEFWEASRDQRCKSYAEAALRYALDLPTIYREDWAEYEAGDYPDLHRVADLLAEYLEEHLGPQTWTAYLGDILLGEGPSREAAIEAAIREYEAQGGYGEYPLIESREELLRRLDVGPRTGEA